MMACFALYRLDERALVLLPGNLVVTGGLGLGAIALAIHRRGWFVLSMAGGIVTAVMGVAATADPHTSWMRLPGSPIVWVVIGLYVSFRLALIFQDERRAANDQELKTRRDAAAKVVDNALADSETGTARATGHTTGDTQAGENGPPGAG